MAVNLYEAALEALDDDEQQQQPKQQPPNPYLETLDAGMDARTRAMRTATVQAHDVTPERAAQVRQLSVKTGLAPDTVERHFDDLSKRVKVESTPYDQMQRETPALAEWASDPSNAAIAKDDLEKLGLLEWIVTAPQRSFAQSVHQMRAASLRTKQLLYGELSPEDRIALGVEKYHQDLGGRLGAGDSWFRGSITGSAQFLANLIYGFKASAPEIAIGAGTGAIIGGGAGLFAGGAGAGPGVVAGAKFGAEVGGLIGGAKFTFDLEAGGAYDEYLDFKDENGQSLDHDVARAAAIATGAINAGLEVTGIEIALRNLPGLKQLGSLGIRTAVKQALRNPTIRAALADTVKGYGKTLTAEVLTEVAQRATTVLAGELGKVASGQKIPLRAPSDVLDDLIREGKGALEAFALGLAVTPATSLVHQAIQVRRAQQGEAFFKALGDGVAQSKTIERMPEAAQAFLEKATADGPVKNLYVDVAPFTEYWQSQHLDPKAVATELTGDATAYDNATQTGEQLRIPTARYAVKLAGTPHHAFFSQELRLSPDDMNAREAMALEASIVEQAKLQAEAPPAELTPAQRVRQSVVEQLVAGGVPRETAETKALLYEAMFGTTGEVLGEDPFARYQRYGLAVKRPDLDLAQRTPQAGGSSAGGQVVAPPVPPPGGATAASRVQPATLLPGGQLDLLMREGIALSPDLAGAQEGSQAPGRTVLDPNEPLSAMENLGAAALRMKAENPHIEADAATLAEKMRTKRPEAPPREPAAGAAATAPAAGEALPAPAGRSIPQIYTQVKAGDIQLDPGTYQFKASDVRGETGRLRDVKTWDTLQGQTTPVLLHQRTDGTLYVADGHQRVNLAQRLEAEGVEVPPLNAIVLREADGWTPAEVRRVAALINVRQDTASPIDIAKLLRERELSPEEAQSIPRSNVFGERFRQAQDLAKLGDAAFQAVVNGELEPVFARFVGQYLTDPAEQIAAVRALAKAEVPNAFQAEQFVRALRSDEFSKAVESDLFGDQVVAESLAVEKAQILDAVRRQLHSQKSAFGNALRNEAKLREAGNVLARGENERLASEAGRFQSLLNLFVDKQGYTATALREEARKVHAGEAKPSDVVAAVTAALERDWNDTQALHEPGVGGQDRGRRGARRVVPPATLSQSLFDDLLAPDTIGRHANATPRQYVSPRERALTADEAETRRLAYALKDGDPAAIDVAAAEMATQVEPDAVLIPIPSSSGDLSVNSALAEAISDRSGAEVLVALERPAPAESSTERRRAGQPGLTAAEHAFKLALAVPAGRPVYFVDNVRTTGATIDAATALVGRGAPLVFAQANEVLEPAIPPADVLDTGEVQLRLPGDVGAVRDVENPTPEFEAPFSLTAPIAKGTGGEQTTLFQGAWHGSPHIFDRFSLHAIGNGEGAQAYGWGLYFASKREVADGYRNRLAGKPKLSQTVYDGAPLYDNEIGLYWWRHDTEGGVTRVPQDRETKRGINEIVARAAYSKPGTEWVARVRGDLERSIANMEKAHAEGRALTRRFRDQTSGAALDWERDDLRNYKAALAVIDEYGDKLRITEQESPGRTYKVDLPEDEDFLDWDKPASEQSPKVQAALRALGVEWTAVPVPPLEEALETFRSPRIQQLAAEDIGIRESLREGYTYASTGNEQLFRNWFYQNQGLMTDRGRIDPTGDEIYRDLQARVVRQEHEKTGEVYGLFGDVGNRAAKATSEALASQGLAGIRYLDGFSRAAGDGSHNFVVFDENLVKILEYDQRGKLGPGGEYQGDLFGDPLPAERSEARDEGLPRDVDAAASLQRDDVEGDFATRTQLVTHRIQQLGASTTILTAEDAATAANYLARGAQERFDVLVTDAEGRPLAVVGSFKGRVDAAAVHPGIILAEAFRIRNAAAIWFVHNHPSGSWTLSAQDKAMTSRIAELFSGTEIEAKGVLAIGRDDDGATRFQFFDPATEVVQDGAVRAPEPGPRVPVLERELATTGRLSGKINETWQAESIVPALARGEFGAVIVDTSNQPIGFLPIDPAAAARLRTEGRLDALYRALSVGNASGAIIHAPQGTEAAALNLANALHAAEVGVLDIIEERDGRPASLRAIRGDLGLTGQFTQGRRGSIVFGPDQQVTINLLERADLSTFLHESGHFFLNVFSDAAYDLAQRDPATLTAEQRRLLGDEKAVLEWLGTKSADDLTEEQHEQFARGFEAYLMEGKAPSLALRSAFARFRAWLIGVYRTLAKLDVHLSDEVRGVFDRMLASEQAINEAAALGRVEPMFTTAESAGMSPAAFELYRGTIADASRSAREDLDRKLMAEVRREQEATYKAQRAEIEQAVAGEVHQQPVYRALAAMQRGTHPDGTLLVEGLESEPLKLSRALLVERFGEERLRRLPKPYIYSLEGGLDPDIVARMFGFGNADEMLTAIEQAPSMNAAIGQETNRRMLQQHGSILLDGTLHEKAQAALANEDRELVIRAELRALAQLRRTVAPFEVAERKQGREAVAGERAGRAYERRWLEAEAKLRIAIAEGHKQVEIDALTAEVQNLRQKARGGPAAIRAAIPPPGVVRGAARKRIAATRFRDIHPEPFWTAARRASAAATEAASRQDFDEAIRQKQQEVINLGLYREANRAKDLADSDVAWVRVQNKPAGRARIGKAGGTFLDQWDAVLDRYEFAPATKKALDRRASLRKWMAAQEGEGLPVDLPEELLEETRRVNWQDLTVEELQGVVEGLRQIAHLAHLKNRLLTHAQQRDLEMLVTRLSESVRNEARGTAREVARDRRPAEERRRTIADFFAGHRKLASMAREMDGFKDGGPMWEAIVRPLNEAGAREVEMNADATRRFAELIERAFPGRQKRTLYTKTYVPAVHKSLSRMERIAVALNWGNDGNRDRVRRAEKWSDQQVQAILDTLSPGDLEFVQGVFDFLNSYWDDIAAKQKRVYGVAPAKVEAVQFRAANGEVRGGYYPLKYDDRLSAKAITGLDLDAVNLAKQAAYVQSTTKRNHTKERTARVTMPVRRDFGVMFSHVAMVIHDLTHHEALIDIGRVLGHPDVQQAILEKYGDLVYKQVRDTVRDVAFGDIPARTSFERVMQHVRTGATIVGLGWRLSVGMLQPLGLANSIVRIGPKWVGVGLARWLRSPRTFVETARIIEDKSPMMRGRARTIAREITEIRNSVGVDTGKFKGWMDEALKVGTFDTVTRQGIADSYFWLIQQMQRIADIPTWLGAYEKARAANESEERSIAMADQAVLDSQGGGLNKDLAQFQRGGPMMRLWTNFYSYFNVVYNQASESRRRTHFRNPVEVGRLASDYFMLFIVPATLGYFIRRALKSPGRPTGGDDDDNAKRIAIDLLRENLSYLSGTMLGTRELSGTIQGFYGYAGPPGARAFAAFGKLGRQTSQGELDAAFWKSLNESAGILLHYPAGQISSTVGGIAALIEGETSNPGAIVAGPPPTRKP